MYLGAVPQMSMQLVLPNDSPQNSTVTLLITHLRIEPQV